MEYKHTQTGYLFLFVLVWMVGVTALIAAFAGDEASEALLIMAITTVIVLAVVFWFSRLTVRVSGSEVRVGFGPGWPRRVFGSYEIVAFRPVRNKWYYGWGVRKIPEGWMYNVWGLDAVELELASGKKFRIGTNDQDDLVAALTTHLALRPG
ncbi:MAG: hypothetical protein QNJ75_00290 [Acidimicrobiia bacterium]|nr:hypothetical protein [Acidimicrobiia bacterium]